MASAETTASSTAVQSQRRRSDLRILDAVQRTAEAEPAPATPRQEEEGADPHPQMDAATPPTPAPDDNADDAGEPEPPNTAIQMAENYKAWKQAQDIQKEAMAEREKERSRKLAAKAQERMAIRQVRDQAQAAQKRR